MKANVMGLEFDGSGLAWGEILEREGFEILPLVRNVKYRAPEVIELLNYKPFDLTGDDLLKSRAIRDELASRYVGEPYSLWLEQRPTEVNLEYVDPYDQKLEPGDGGVIPGESPEAVKVPLPGEEIVPQTEPVGEYETEHLPYMSDAVMEVQEGAVMNTPGYEELAGVLVRAYDQAASGKGKERHAKDVKAFVDQPMQKISDLLGSQKGMAYQAIKKIDEARGLPTREAQVRELLGAIVYVAGMVLWLEKQPMTDDEAEEDLKRQMREWGAGLGTALLDKVVKPTIGPEKEKRTPDEDLRYVPSASEASILHSSGVKAVIKDGEVRFEHPEKQP